MAIPSYNPKCPECGNELHVVGDSYWCSHCEPKGIGISEQFASRSKHALDAMPYLSGKPGKIERLPDGSLTVGYKITGDGKTVFDHVSISEEGLKQISHGHEALPLPSGILKTMKSATAHQMRKLAATILEPLEAERDSWRRTAEKLEAEKQEAEAAVKLCWSDMYFQPLEDLCVLCHKRHKCGPGHNDSEPCDTFTRLEERHEMFAPVRKVLDRMKS